MDIDYSNYHRDSDYRKFEPMFRNIFLKRYYLIKRYVRSGPGKVLDIGCSNGVFLDLFGERGWETWGIEPSESGDVAGKKGHKIIASFFEKVELSKNYYDLVIMNHTLEHMDNPSFVLKKIHTILKKGGTLFIDVPNAGGFGARLFGKYWPYRLPDEHKWQFTKRTLSEIVGKSGFKILCWESRSGIFEYANPLLELKRKRFVIDILTAPYAVIATVLKMGDSMSIVGRKV